MTRSRAIAVVLLVAVAGALIARAVHKRHGAMFRNREFAALVLSGTDPYSEPIHAPYPPSYGIVMAPALVLPLPVARGAWVVLQLAALGVLLAVMQRWWRELTARDPPWWIVAGTLVLASRYLLRDMAGGGGNLVFGTLVLLACCRPGERPGEDRKPWTGLGLGIVLAAKPTPVLFLVWLLARGRRRTLLVSLVTAVILHLSPMLTLGPSGWWQAYTHWLHGVWLYGTRTDVFAVPAYDFPPFDWMHQSLRFCFARFLGTVPQSELAMLPEFARFRGLGIAPATIALINTIVSLALLVTTFWLVLRVRNADNAWHELAAPAALFVLTLLLSPITWKAHHVQAIPAFYVLLAQIALGVRVTRLRGGLIAYLILCSLPGQDIVGKAGKELMQSLYVVALAALWLLAEVLVSISAPPALRCDTRSTR